MAGKAKNMCQRCNFLGGEGGGGWKRSSGAMDMAPLSLGNLGAKFSEMSIPHFTIYFTQIGRCHL